MMEGEFKEVMPGIFSKSDRDSIIEDLRVHNEKLLEEHKNRLEAQFQMQIQQFQKQFMSQFTNSRPLTSHNNDSNFEQQQPPLRRLITPAAADRKNDNFLESSKNPSTAPIYKLFEGGERKGVVRAAMEHPADNAVVVKLTSSGQIIRQQQQQQQEQQQEQHHEPSLKNLPGAVKTGLHTHSLTYSLTYSLTHPFVSLILFTCHAPTERTNERTNILSI